MPISVINRWTIPPLGGRDNLIPGIDMPGPGTAGVLDNVARTNFNTSSTTSTAFTTPGATYSNFNFYGNILLQAANVTFYNCYFYGRSDGVIPSSGAVVNGNNTANVNTQFIDCTMNPIAQKSPGINGFVGHDMTLLRCEIMNCQDGMQLHNINLTMPYLNKDVVQQCWIHDMAWFTAATTGIVHPSDIETHNDCIQHMGGGGAIILGNRLDAYYARNSVGHWWVVGNPRVEPYVMVAQHSLPDGGPYQPLPDAGTGSEATGRYNVGDLCAIQITADAGYSRDMTITDNWINGGQFGINAGGDRPASIEASLGDCLRNRFSRDQGLQGSGGNNTWTVNSDHSNWLGHWNVPTTGVDRNYYGNDGGTITTRIT